MKREQLTTILIAQREGELHGAVAGPRLKDVDTSWGVVHQCLVTESEVNQIFDSGLSPIMQHVYLETILKKPIDYVIPSDLPIWFHLYCLNKLS